MIFVIKHLTSIGTTCCLLWITLIGVKDYKAQKEMEKTFGKQKQSF